MSNTTGLVVSVHRGAENQLEKAVEPAIELALDGIVGDRHRGLSRLAWEGDKNPEGTLRRNERHWSAVSAEELDSISEAMNLAEPLTASVLGANLCISGLTDLSRLPRGTLLRFPSGAVLMVEEYNPPCKDMGEAIAQTHRDRAGATITASAFSKAAGFFRGVVGVVEVGGKISAGDAVEVERERLPKWLR